MSEGDPDIGKNLIVISTNVEFFIILMNDIGNYFMSVI